MDRNIKIGGSDITLEWIWQKIKWLKILYRKLLNTVEEMAEFWDTHDLTDYEEYLTPVEATISAHPKHHYVVTLSDTLETLLRQVQQAEGVSLNTLVNLWVQEKLQQYVTSLSE